MKEAGDALSFFTNQEGAFRFFALLFPGFVALAVYDLRVPGERRKFGDMGVALVAYSIMIDSLTAAYLTLWPIPPGYTARLVLIGILGDVVVPMLVGWFVVDLREWLASNGRILSATPKAWDALFRRLRRVPKGESIALVLTLSDGRKVGGFWAERPMASSYPAEEDILITVPVLVDQETGLFTERVNGAIALLLKRDDIIAIEAFDGNVFAKAANERAIREPDAANASTVSIQE